MNKSLIKDIIRLKLKLVDSMIEMVPGKAGGVLKNTENALFDVLKDVIDERKTNQEISETKNINRIDIE